MTSLKIHYRRIIELVMFGLACTATSWILLTLDLEKPWWFISGIIITMFYQACTINTDVKRAFDSLNDERDGRNEQK